MDLRKVFINNLKIHRKIRGISQLKLAELCDSSIGYIGQIEIGNKFPSVEMIDKMSKALKIRPYMLFWEEPEPESENLTPSLSEDQYLMPESMQDDLILQLIAAIRRVVKRQYPF